MSEVQQQASPGWYPTEQGPRWWDGYQWSPAQVRPLKDAGVAYLLWFFLGGFGGHHFYVGNPVAGVLMALLNVGGWLLTPLLVGWVILPVFFIWWIVDAFLIPGYVRNVNAR